MFLVLLKWEVVAILGNRYGVKDKIMLHGLREVKCRWEVGEVERWEGWKGNEVVRWKR